MKVSTKLFSMVAVMIFVIIVVGITGLYVANNSSEGLKTVYKDRTEPLEQLKTISDMYAVHIVDTAHKTRDGGVNWGMARERVARSRQVIAKNWQAYIDTYANTDEKKLQDEAVQLMKTADAAVDRLEVILRQEDKAALTAFAASDMYPAIDPLSKKIVELAALQLVLVRHEYEKSLELYENGKLLMFMLTAGGLLFSVLMALAIIRQLLKDLGGEPAFVREIAQAVADGNLSVDVRVDEARKGSVLFGMKVMVNNLNAMMTRMVEKNRQLEESLALVKRLEGMITICSCCKKVMDEQNSWLQLEKYITERSEAEFSHGLCPECFAKQMEELEKIKQGRQ